MEEQFNFSRETWVFLWVVPLLIVLAIILGGIRSLLSSRRVASQLAAQRLAASQAAAVQRRMTVFPKPPHKAVKYRMANLLASGAGDSEWNGVYVENGESGGYPAYELDSNHWIVWGPDDGFWKMWISIFGETPDGTQGVYQGGTNPLDPTDGTWSSYDGSATSPGPTVTLYVAPDTVAPTPSSASINTVGTGFTLNWTEADSAPVTGSTGLSLAGLTHGVATLSGVSTTGTTTTATISRAIKSDETPTLSYTPGNFADSAGTPNTVASFSGQSITNNSTVMADSTAPAIASASVTNGVLTVNFTEAGSPPILPATGIVGFTLNNSRGNTLSLAAGVTTGSLVATFAITGSIYSTDTLTLDYSATTGNVTDSATPANDLATSTGTAVTNNSTAIDPRISSRMFHIVTETETDTAIDNMAAASKGYFAFASVVAASGASPTLDVIIQGSATTNDEDYTDLVTFDQFTANGKQLILSTNDNDSIPRYIRVKKTVGGTTPKFALLIVFGTKVI